jgi:hypothetical protein
MQSGGRELSSEAIDGWNFARPGFDHHRYFGLRLRAAERGDDLLPGTLPCGAQPVRNLIAQ